MIFDHGSIRLRWRDRMYLLPTQWRMICLVTSAVALAAAMIQLRFPVLYEASTRLVFDHVTDDSSVYLIAQGTRLISSNDDLRERARELLSKELLSGIITPTDLSKRWGISDEMQILTLLASRVHVESESDDNTLTLKVSDLSPAVAAILANAIATRYIQNRDQVVKASAKALIQRLERERKVAEQTSGVIEAQLLALSKQNVNQRNREITELRQRLVGQHNLIHSLDAKLQLARLEMETQVHTVKIAEMASPKTCTLARPLFLRLIPLLIAGLVTGLLTALIMTRRLSPSLIAGEMMDRMNLPLIGFAPLTGCSIPSGVDLPESILELYRDLRNRLLRNPTGKCALYAIQPCQSNDLTAEVSVNLASTLADSGHLTLVIDAHLRRPSLHQAFDSEKEPGLSDCLAEELSLEETVIRTSYPNLWFLPAGSEHPDPGSLLSGRKMEDLVWELKRRFDFVLIKTPAVCEASDATLIGALVDYVLVVSPFLHFSEKRIREIRSILEMRGARLNGVILTAEDHRFRDRSIDLSKALISPVSHGVTPHAKWSSRMRAALRLGKQAIEDDTDPSGVSDSENSKNSPSKSGDFLNKSHEKEPEPSPWAAESTK